MTTSPDLTTSPLWAALEQAASALREGASSDAGRVAAALEAIGRLLAAGVAEDEIRSRAPLSLDPALAEAALDRDTIAVELETEAIALLEALDGDHDGGELHGDAPRISSHLAARDRAEMELLGAAFVARRPVDEVSAGASARLGFDLAVRPRAFELVAHNVERAERSSTLHPAHRSRFWWWFEGASLDPRAVTAMSAVASLVARSPEARERFEQLVRAEEAWSALTTARKSGAAPEHRAIDEGAAQSRAGTRPQTGTPPRAGARVVRLRDWIQRRAAGDRAGLALAAAPLDEALLLETNDAHVSFAAPDVLIVDLLADRRPDSVPALLVPGDDDVPAAQVAGAVERFTIALAPGWLDGERIVLRLPLLGGDVEIELPPRTSE